MHFFFKGRYLLAPDPDRLAMAAGNKTKSAKALQEMEKTIKDGVDKFKAVQKGEK